MTTSSFTRSCAIVAIIVLAHVPVLAQEAVAASAPGERVPRLGADDPGCQPDYPGAALRAGVEGTSAIRFTITPTGRLTVAEVVQSSGPTREHRLLDNAFKAAIVKCPFLPGRDAQGRATGGAITVTHVWQLPEAASAAR
jgi:protein TonB